MTKLDGLIAARVIYEEWLHSTTDKYFYEVLDSAIAAERQSGERGGQDFSVDDSKLAREILTNLGFAGDVSLDPGADSRRDRIADMIARNYVKRTSPLPTATDPVAGMRK